MTPSEYYHKDTQHQGFKPEAGQLAILELMDQLHARLGQGGLFSRFKRDKNKGLYIHGGVGRGKTYLLDIFHQTAPPNSSLRMHFHHFVRDIHQRLLALPKTPNPMPIIARQIASQARVLCLDELFVDDIADAMLLAGLLPALGEYGVSLICTSNLKPDQLYENGLQRLHFLQAIDWLKDKNVIIGLEHDTDFRYQIGDTLNTVFANSDGSLEKFFLQRTGRQAIRREGMLWLQGREVPFLIQTNNSIMFDFHSLCATTRSVRDYLELAEYYRLLAIKDVYMMGEQQDDVAKRFMHLVDTLYDHNIQLALSVEVPLEALYQGRRLQQNFTRTLSRLYEMTSGDNDIKLG